MLSSAGRPTLWSRSPSPQALFVFQDAWDYVMGLEEWAQWVDVNPALTFDALLATQCKKLLGNRMWWGDNQPPDRLEGALHALAARPATRAALAAGGECATVALACLALAGRADLVDLLLGAGASVSQAALEYTKDHVLEGESFQWGGEVYTMDQMPEAHSTTPAAARRLLEARRQPWSPERHGRHAPPALRAAARALALCMHRVGLWGGLVPAVVRHAARPLSAWERMGG